MSDSVIMRFGHYRVEISHPGKTLFPDAGITKQDLAEYYRDIADIMLPHLRGRPLTMRRFPDGIDGKSFYQKEVPDYFPDWIKTVTVEKEDGKVTQVIADNAKTLVYLANQACITPHTWLSRTDCLDHPDMLVFDLDPSADDFNAVRNAANEMRGILEDLGLAAFVKTTGSSGLHVVSPLDRNADFDTVRAFAHDVSRVLAKRNPSELTVEPRKNKRRGRVFIDTARNAYAQTVAPPYAVRPRPGAPVATPLDWDEIDGKDNISQRYRMKTIFKRLGQKNDPWKKIRYFARSLTRPRYQLNAMLDELKD